MSEDWDLDGLDDLDNIDDLDDNNIKDSNKKSSHKKKDKKSGLSRFIPLFIFIVIILIFLYYLTSTGSNSNDSENSEQESETTTSEVDQRVELPLINTEQVAWTDEVCRLSSQDEWGSSLHNMYTYDDKKSPKTIRDDISDILDRNAYRLGVRSVNLKELPEKIHSQMLEKQENTAVSDANKKIGEDIDPNIINMSQQLSSSFEDYSQSLYDMKSDLDSIADYDENGLRSTIMKVSKSFKKVNDSFNNDINNAFNIKYFDNLSTLEKASESENCSGSFANLDELDQKDKEELSRQNKIREYAIFERCDSFINNSKNSTVMNDDLNFNIEMCNDVLSRTVVDKDDPLFKNGIDQQDSKRAMPKIESSLLTNTQQDQLNPTEETTTSSESSSGTE